MNSRLRIGNEADPGEVVDIERPERVEYAVIIRTGRCHELIVVNEIADRADVFGIDTVTVIFDMTLEAPVFGVFAGSKGAADDFPRIVDVFGAHAIAERVCKVDAGVPRSLLLDLIVSERYRQVIERFDQVGRAEPEIISGFGDADAFGFGRRHSEAELGAARRHVFEVAVMLHRKAGDAECRILSHCDVRDAFEAPFIVVAD